MATVISRTSFQNIEILLFGVFGREEEHTVETQCEIKKKINNMMASIQSDNRGMAALFKEKAKVYTRIHKRLDLLRRAKTSWTAEQMDSFAAFTASDRQKNTELAEILEVIKDRQDLKKVKREFLHNSVDYGLIYDELAEIYDYQQQALTCLKSMVDAGRGMLRLL
jgi:hypothetical protein